MLSRLSWEIMNATADDWESLDQVMPSIMPHCGPVDAPAIARAIACLVNDGLMEEMRHGSVEPTSVVEDPMEYWFRMTPHGRELWDSQARRFVNESPPKV